MDVSWYRSLGARISRLRARAGLTPEQLAELAERAGIGASYVARIESGTRRPTLDMLGALADALGVPLHRLVADVRAVRAAEGREAWGKSAHALSSVVLDRDDADIAILVEVATRLERA